MNTVTIILLLSVCFCAQCGATPAVSSLDQVRLVPSNHINEISTSLHRITRQSGPFNFIEGVASDILSIPSNLATELANFILSVISKIRSAFLTFLKYLESWIKAVAPQVNSSQNSNQRRRRSTVSNGLSDLIADLPNLLQSPLSYFQQATSSVANTAGEQITTVVQAIASWIWNFVTMQLLPWLHGMLKKLQKSNILPPFLNQAIGNADSLYSFLRLVSLLGSSIA